MPYYYAPLEGVTTSIYRSIHHNLFPGADRYYTPFFSPTSDHRLTARELREILPENNRGVNVIPQILSKSAEDFLWAADQLADMGYEEVNFNIGCPSATVTAKGKGAGLLLHPKELDAMLEEIFLHTPIRVSVKTRIGYQEPEEWEQILPIYNRYPISELILHPRTRKEMYTGEPHRDVFVYTLEKSRAPVCYNGNLFHTEQCKAFAAEFPAVPLMLGRGAVVDPSLFRQLRGGAPISREELLRFHTELYAAYREELGAPNAMRKMKELWQYFLRLFDDSEQLGKKIARTKDVAAFDFYVASAFQELCFAGKPHMPVYG